MKGRCRASEGQAGSETWRWEEERVNLVQRLHRAPETLFEVLGSSVHLNWSVPHSHLGPNLAKNLATCLGERRPYQWA